MEGFQQADVNLIRPCEVLSGGSPMSADLQRQALVKHVVVSLTPLPTCNASFRAAELGACGGLVATPAVQRVRQSHTLQAPRRVGVEETVTGAGPGHQARCAQAFAAGMQTIQLSQLDRVVLKVEQQSMLLYFQQSTAWLASRSLPQGSGLRLRKASLMRMMLSLCAPSMRHAPLSSPVNEHCNAPLCPELQAVERGSC